jgi:hypothetical protein
MKRCDGLLGLTCCLSLALPACGASSSNEDESTTGGESESTGVEESGTEESGTSESGDGDGDGGDGDGEVTCDDPVPLAEVEGVFFEEVPPDFTLNTLRGPFNHASEWTGCDSYYFVGFHNNLFNPSEGNLDDFFADVPENTHFFFFARNAGSEQEAMGAVGAPAAAIESYLTAQGTEFYDTWTNRFHYVTTPGAELPSWMVDLPQVSDSLGVAIDRWGRLREGGFLDIFVGQNTEPLFRNIAYSAGYYNYEVEYADARAAEEDGVTVVNAVDGMLISDTGSGTINFEMPDADTMAGFDTMQIELNFECPGGTNGGHPYRGNCPAWDRIAQVAICLDAECTERWPVAEAITSYWRPTRSLLEATPFLAFFKDGGEFQLFVEWGPSFDPGPLETTINFRMFNEGKGMRPTEITPLWNGGAFNAMYNDAKLPVDVMVPDTAQKVEIATIVTGHGIETNNCAEYCNHEHEFTVNGSAPYAVEYEPMTSNVNSFGCAQLTHKGVQPNQWGSWYFGRAAWCPGWGVQPWIGDVTADINTGATNTFTYDGFFGDGPGGPGGSIFMGSYAVVYE